MFRYSVGSCSALHMELLTVKLYYIYDFKKTLLVEKIQIRRFTELRSVKIIFMYYKVRKTFKIDDLDKTHNNSL